MEATGSALDPKQQDLDPTQEHLESKHLQARYEQVNGTVNIYISYRIDCDDKDCPFGKCTPTMITYRGCPSGPCPP
jgi:hypothetical protein